MADDYLSQLTGDTSGFNGMLANNAAGSDTASYKVKESKSAPTDEQSLLSKINANEKEDKDFAAGQLKNIESLKVPERPMPKEAPDEASFKTPAIDKFGTGSMMIATLGSLFTRKHLTNALNSAAEVNKAVAAQDASNFKAAYDKWKSDTDQAWRFADWDQQMFKDELAKGEAEARIHAVGTKNEAALMALQMKMQDNYIKTQEKALKDAKSGSSLIMEHAEAAYEDAIAAGKTPEEAQMAQMKAFGEAKAMMSGKGDSSGQKIDFGSLKPDDIVPGTGVTLAAVDQKVEALKNGGSYTDAGISMRTKSNPLKDAVDDRLAQKYPDFNRVQAEIDLAGDKAEARKEGIISGSLKTAANLLDQSIPLLREASKNVDQSNWTDLNSFENYFKTHSNDPNLTKFRVALQTTMNDYTALGVRNGQTSDHARVSTEKLVNDLMSKQGIDAFADQIEKEKKSVLKGLDVTRGRGLAGKPPDEKHVKMLKDDPSEQNKEYFDEAFGDGAAAKVLGQ